jgi:hypothetical protein
MYKMPISKKNQQFNMGKSPLSMGDVRNGAKRTYTFEIFLVQIIVYLLLWLWNDFVATLLSLSFAAIGLFVLIISLIAEMIDRSKVPRWYFYVIILSVLTPILVGSLFMYIKNGNLDWMIFSYGK